MVLTFIKNQEPTNCSETSRLSNKMAQHEDDLPSYHLSSYDYYGFAVYKQGSLLAEEDSRNHDYK